MPTTIPWQARVTVDPVVCHGRPCIKGTRIAVSVILDNLAEGATTDDILAAYPSLTADDVRAAMGFAAELARERVVTVSVGAA